MENIIFLSITRGMYKFYIFITPVNYYCVLKMKKSEVYNSMIVYFMEYGMDLVQVLLEL